MDSKWWAKAEVGEALEEVATNGEVDQKEGGGDGRVTPSQVLTFGWPPSCSCALLQIETRLTVLGQEMTEWQSPAHSPMQLSSSQGISFRPADTLYAPEISNSCWYYAAASKESVAWVAALELAILCVP